MTTPAPVGPIRIAIAFYSGYGHTRILADAVAEGAALVSDVIVDVIDIETLTEQCWRTLDDADAIIFGSPTYIGGVAGPFKCFIDATSTRFKARRWAGKLAAGFTVSSSPSGDSFGTLQQLNTFALQQAMLWIGVGLLPGWDSKANGSPDNSNRLGSCSGSAAQAFTDLPADHGVTPSDRATAGHLGQRVAVAAVLWAAGRAAVDGVIHPDVILGPTDTAIPAVVPTGRAATAQALSRELQASAALGN
jgi:multimeric flavodoxin WrbA